MNYNSSMAQSFKSMMSEEPDVPHVAPMTDITGKAVNINDQKVAATVNAMTKDYSALMKAIDKKKGK
jgi:acylphosphatase